MSITYISAFLNINRENWNNIYRRSFPSYLDSFLPFVELFSNQDTEQNMVLFIDKQHSEEVKKILLPTTRIELIEIDMKWMEENSHVWKTLSREREIMNSQSFKNLVGSRIDYPEAHIPEYTLINHAKIDFINYIISNNLSDSEYFSWVDFGYFATSCRIPSRLIDISKIPDLDKINYTLINSLTSEDQDIYLTLSEAKEKVGGFWFFGRRDKMVEYQQLYHNILDFYQTNHISDDDQALALACYFKNPDLFCMHYTGKWHAALVLFSK